jgi:predicted MFS family arabinose efflux permease
VRLGWRGANWLFLACTASHSMVEGHLNAFTPLRLHDLGYDNAEIAVWSGLLYSVTTALALPLAPFWGVLAERYSRRKVVLRSYFLMAGAMLISAWAPDIAGLVIGRMLVGLSFGSFSVIIAAQALLVPRRVLGASIAMVQAATPIASSLGPPLGSALIPFVGVRGLFVCGAGLVLISALALTLLMPEPAPPIKRGSVLGRTGEVMGVIWTTLPVRWNFTSAFLLRGATSVVETYLPVRITQLSDNPATAIGWVLGLYGAATTAATWLCGRVVDRIDVTLTYQRMMALGALIAVGIAVAPWLWLLTLLATLRSIPVAFSNTLLFSHLARALPREQQTAVMAFAPVPRNIGALLLNLTAASAAGASAAIGLGPTTAAMLVGAASYAGTYLCARALRGTSRQEP